MMRIYHKGVIYVVKRVIRESKAVHFVTVDNGHHTLIFASIKDAEQFMEYIYYDGYSRTDGYIMDKTLEGWI